MKRLIDVFSADGVLEISEVRDRIVFESFDKKGNVRSYSVHKDFLKKALDGNPA
jgi:hypothetical protein